MKRLLWWPTNFDDIQIVGESTIWCFIPTNVEMGTLVIFNSMVVTNFLDTIEKVEGSDLETVNPSVSWHKW